MKYIIYFPIAGKSSGNGDSFSLCVFIGVGGRGSGSEHPSNQYEIMAPLPLSSTSPRSSRRNVPNLSKICFAAAET